MKLPEIDVGDYFTIITSEVNRPFEVWQLMGVEGTGTMRHRVKPVIRENRTYDAYSLHADAQVRLLPDLVFMGDWP